MTKTDRRAAKRNKARYGHRVDGRSTKSVLALLSAKQESKTDRRQDEARVRQAARKARRRKKLTMQVR